MRKTRGYYCTMLFLMRFRKTGIMRSFLGIMIILASLPGMPDAADVTALTEIPVEATALHARLIGKVQPNVRLLINEQALKLRQGTTDPNAASGNVDAVFSRAGLSSKDVSEAAFIVMMQATKDMDGDIKAMMEEVKALTSAKHKLRDLFTRVNQDVAKNAHKKDTDVCAPPACGGYQAVMMEAAPVVKRVRPRTPLVLREPITIGELRNLASHLKSSLDGMNEMSEMTSLRLQMTMDRRSKFISTLVSMMNKISSSQDAVIQKMQ